MFADEIRRAIEAASRIALPSVTALLWRAYGEGKVTEAEAEALSGLIELRQVGSPDRGNQNLPSSQVYVLRQAEITPEAGASPGEGMVISPIPLGGRRTSVGSRPRTDASMERRRRWAASGRLPPALAARFTLAEQAVLALVAAETTRRGDCRLAVGHLAAIVGVAETTVRNAIREARTLGLLTVEERRLTGFRNDTNVLRIVSPEWTAWLRLAQKGAAARYHHHGDPLPSERSGHHDPALCEGGGCKSSNRTPTQISTQGKTRIGRPSRRSPAPLESPSRETSRTGSARPRHCAVEGAAPGPR
jgi:hypothetical protein